MTKEEIIAYAIQKAKDHNYDPMIVEVLFGYVSLQTEIRCLAERMDKDIVTGGVLPVMGSGEHAVPQGVNFENHNQQQLEG